VELKKKEQTCSKGERKGKRRRSQSKELNRQESRQVQHRRAGREGEPDAEVGVECPREKSRKTP